MSDGSRTSLVTLLFVPYQLPAYWVFRKCDLSWGRYQILYTEFPPGLSLSMVKTLLLVTYQTRPTRQHSPTSCTSSFWTTDFHHIWMSSPPCHGQAVRRELWSGDSQRFSPGLSSCSPSPESCPPSSSSRRNLEEHGSQSICLSLIYTVDIQPGVSLYSHTSYMWCKRHSLKTFLKHQK